MVFRLTHQKRSSLSHIDRKIALSFGAVVMVLMLLITGVATWLFRSTTKNRRRPAVRGVGCNFERIHQPHQLFWKVSRPVACRGYAKKSTGFSLYFCRI